MPPIPLQVPNNDAEVGKKLQTWTELIHGKAELRGYLWRNGRRLSGMLETEQVGLERLRAPLKNVAQSRVNILRGNLSFS